MGPKYLPMFSSLPSIPTSNTQKHRKDEPGFRSNGNLVCILRSLQDDKFLQILCSEPGDDDIMHFCPRVGCRRWYHRECLVQKDYTDSVDKYRGDRGVRLLAVDPDMEVPCAILAWFSEPIMEGDEDAVVIEPESRVSLAKEKHHNHKIELRPARTRRNTGSSCSSCSSSSSSMVSTSSAQTSTSTQQCTTVYSSTSQTSTHLPLNEALSSMSISPNILSHLPPALIRIAQMPIVRCPQAGASWAISGNLREVVLARRFVYAAFENAGVGQTWSEKINELFQLVNALQIQRDDVDRNTSNEIQGSASRMMEEDSELPSATETKDTHPTQEDVLLAAERKFLEDLRQLCNGMSKFTLLASPYVPYWEQRQEELEAHTDSWIEGPALICPQCHGAL